MTAPWSKRFNKIKNLSEKKKSENWRDFDLKREKIKKRRRKHVGYSVMGEGHAYYFNDEGSLWIKQNSKTK